MSNLYVIQVSRFVEADDPGKGSIILRRIIVVEVVVVFVTGGARAKRFGVTE